MLTADRIKGFLGIAAGRARAHASLLVGDTSGQAKGNKSQLKGLFQDRMGKGKSGLQAAIDKMVNKAH